MAPVEMIGPGTNSTGNGISCIFPTLTDGFIPDQIGCHETSPQTLPLDLGVLGEVNATQDAREAAILAGWTLLLAKYLGTEEVSVHVVRNRGSTFSVGMCSLTANESLTQNQLLAQAHEYLDSVQWREILLKDGAFQLLSDSISNTYANTAIVFTDEVGPEARQRIMCARNDDLLVLVISSDPTGRTTAYMSYRHSLTTDAQAANVAQTFAKVLSGLIADPSILIGEIDYVSESHLNQIWQFNSDVPGPWMACFHDVVEAHANECPHAPAIDAWDGKFTYGELMSLAKSLARELQGHGVRPGVIIPIGFERSAWALVGMLAVSLAGGSFVSIPPSLPPERTNAIMKLIESPLILTKSIHGPVWEGRMNWIAIDNHCLQTGAAPAPLAQPTDLFYIVFTSGSTGTPKGCMISHRNWLSGALRNAPNWCYEAGGRVLQRLSLTFDMSLLEICTSLGSGACVCIPSAEEVEESLAGVINNYNVTQIIMTPSLVRSLTPEAVPGLKTMCLGGEAFQKEIITTWAERVNLFQFYGPCECSINSSYRAILGKEADPLTIGRPNSCACWVVEPSNHNKLVPIGAIGELLVSGPVVGMGYWNDPVKTAQVFLDKVDFVKHNDTLSSGSPFYKTGDLVRWNSDGTLTFCGRVGMAMKLNGQRIELAEVEYHLALDDRIQLAMALLPDVGCCQKNLVAVLTLKATVATSGSLSEICLLDGRKDQSNQHITKKIVSRLRKALPHYMVPTIWVFLRSMPISQSGKIDRVKVQRWIDEMSEETFAAVTGKGFDAVDRFEHMTYVEQQIGQTWGEVLGIPLPHVGLGQPFIALGGDSIKALEVVSKCRTKGIHITIADILACVGVSEAARLSTLTATDKVDLFREDASFVALWDQLRDEYDLSKLGISTLNDVEDVYPCTKIQEGIFLGQIRRPGAYHMRFFYKINAKDGRLPDVCEIKHAWSSVIAVHPSLRTIFVEDLTSDAIYHSVVLREPTAELHALEIQAVTPSEALATFTQSRVIPFSPLSLQHRLRILSCQGRAQYLMLEISHAIMDGASLAIFVADFSRACSGKRLPCGGPVYRDFVVYQRKQVSEESAKYWASYLERCTPCLFPVKPSRNVELNPARMRKEIEFERSASFISRCNERHVTTACVIRAAWALVLREYTGLHDICFGYVVSLRNAPINDINRIFGVCIHTQPCHVRIHRDSTMAKLAKDIQVDYVASVPHQQYPFVEATKQRHPDGSQLLFNTILSMEWIPPMDVGEDSNIELQEMREQDDPAEYDIGVSVHVQDGRIKLGFLHWPWIADFEIVHLAKALKSAMSIFIDDPDESVDSMSLVNTRDVEQMLSDHNIYPTLAAIDGTVFTYIDHQSKERPTAPAIDAWDGKMNYQQLEEESAIVAAELVGLGIRRGDVVVFCMDRSRRVIIIMLGIMRSGAVFVASSHDTSRTRLQALISHSKPRLIIADAKYIELFDGMYNDDIPFSLVAAASLWDTRASVTSLPLLRARDVVYIVYTSGSTGEPKGVVIEHGSLVTSVVMGHGKRLAYHPGVRVLQFTSLTFDIAMMEIFTTLAFGGCVCIPSEQDRLSNLVGCMSRLQVNVAILTPSVSRIFCPKDVPTLKQLGLGGESMTRHDLDRLASMVDLYNGFGPAEATILVSLYGPMKSTDEPNNIGYPVDGTRLWVAEVGNPQRLAPIGGVGELLIESHQLAKGYLLDDQQTKAAFIDNPTWLGKERRVYRTGDLVHYASDGSLRYVGRKDTQVKLRGHRIELTQIEHDISVCWPHVYAVVELIRPEGASTDAETLVAFIHNVAANIEYREETSVTADSDDCAARPITIPSFVREHLAKNLASHMVPSFFFSVPTMPITISGKVDRCRLRQMGATLTKLKLPNGLREHGRDVPFISKLERRLFELWALTLHLEPRQVRLDDSFFQLGGTSITAMKLSAAARQQGINFTVPQLFRNDTVRKLASSLQQELPALEPQLNPVRRILQNTMDQLDETILDDNESLELAAANLVALARQRGSNLDLAKIDQQIRAKMPVSEIDDSEFREGEPFSLLSKENHVRELIFQAAISQCHVEREDIEDLYPATPLQEGMISLTARQPGTYTAVLTLGLPASIDIDQFQAAWETTAYAHPILRTRIIQADTYNTFQVVLRKPGLIIEQYSITDNLPELTINMGLGTPLIRLAVIRGNSNAAPARLIFAIHHALYDGWSLPRLKAQVQEAYSGTKLKRQPFKPFIAYLQHSKPAAREFWRAELDGFNCTTFPSLPSTTYQVIQNTELNQRIPLMEAPLGKYTLSTKLRLAWAITVSRYTAVQDIVFGFTAAGRAVPVIGIEGVLGPTISTFPLRIRVDGAQGVAAMLEAVQEQSLGSLEYEHLGLQHISRLGICQAAACRFQTLMVINSNQDEEKSTLFTGEHILPDIGVETYALVLVCEPTENMVNVRAKYDSRVICQDELARVLDHFGYVLTQLVAEPVVPINQLEVLTTADWGTLLAWNPPVQSYDHCVHWKVHEWSLVQPHALSVCAWDGNWSYQELDEVTSRFARRLRIEGVGPELIVPLYFERSRWLAVAMVAVMKAGGVFMLLDPTHPYERVRSLVRRVNPLILLTSKDLMQAAEAHFGVNVMVVGGDIRESCVSSAPLITVSEGPRSACYAVFTSGSTGSPKGSVAEHGAVLCSLSSIVQRLQLDRTSRVLQFSSFAFDVSIMEHFATFLAGGCVCIPSESDRTDALAKAINDFCVNWAFMTPSAIRTIHPHEISCLSNLVLLGETPFQGDYETWAPHVNLVQAYGVTECSVLATITDRVNPTDNPRNIGKPSGCRCWVADQENVNKPAPIGAVGELIIDGPIVNQGYFDDVEQTALSFIQRPKWLEPWHEGRENRVYRTGDLVRYGPDGCLLYVGRKDTQVKLNGQRIELSEIEANLRRLIPEARNIIAEVIGGGHCGPPRLIVLVESIQDTHHARYDGGEARFLLPTTEFRSKMEQAERSLTLVIPSHMVPLIYIPVSSIPLSSSGKADRLRLRDMVTSCSETQLQRYAVLQEPIKQVPLTEREHLLQQVWARALSVDPHTIGVHDDFFRIGGDSITGMQVATKCNSLGVTVSSGDLFRYRTIARLVAHIQTQEQDVADAHGSNETLDGWFNLSPMQKMFFDLVPEGFNDLSCSYLFRTCQNLRSSQVVSALEFIVSLHPMLRARFRKSSDGQWHQKVTAATERRYIFQSHEAMSKEEVARICIRSQRLMEVEQGPLLVVDLIDLWNGQQYLHISSHRLVVDLQSSRILHEDLEECLRVGTLSASTSMPFQTWCRAQAEYSSRSLPPSIGPPLCCVDDFVPTNYWGMATDRSISNDAHQERFHLDQATTAHIIGDANQAFRTQPIEIIQAALLHSFVRIFSNRRCPTIYTVEDGRELWHPAIDLTRTVGCLTTMTPTTVQLHPTHSIIDVVRFVKDARRQYFARQLASCSSGQGLGGRKSSPHEALMEILLMYQAPCQPLQEPVMLERLSGNRLPSLGGHMRLFALIEVSASILDGCLHVGLAFSREMEHQPVIRQWFNAYQSSLCEAASKLSSLWPSSTLSDFPLLPVTYEQLDQFVHPALRQHGIMLNEVEDIYPCSPMQQGILLSQIRDPAYYQNRLAFEIVPNNGYPAVDIHRLLNAWKEVTNRHAILRTLFLPVSHKGLADQVVLKSIDPQIDIDRGQSGAVNQRKAASKKGTPDYRVVVRALSCGSVSWEWQFNHALVDALSIVTVQRDLALAYEGRLTPGKGPQYRDYVQYLQHLDQEPARTYWTEYLKDISEPCFLPRLTREHTSDDGNPKVQSVRLGLDIGASLRDFCKENCLTMTNIFHIAWAVVLRCYLAVDSVCFGYVVFGRDIPLPEVEAIVGPCMNTLITQVHLPPQSSLLSVLEANQKTLVNGQVYKHFSLMDLYHTKKLSGSSLFNTGVSVQDLTQYEMANESAITIKPVEGDDPAEFDVTVNIGISERNIDLNLIYWTSIMSKYEAITMSHTFSRALNEVLYHPTKRISEIDCTSDICKRQVSIWNGILPSVIDDVAYNAIQQQCTTKDDAEAVCGWDGSFTYREVEELSSRLAQHLTQLGVPLGSVVPLYTEKSRWVVIAMIGIMKAGAAFALLDVSYPLAWLQEVCGDLDAQFILASQTTAAIATHLAATVVAIGDSTATIWPPDSSQWCPPYVTPRSPAYVIYTSGSTGKPKGVCIDHGSLCTNGFIITEHLGLNSSSRVLQFSSYAFDLSVLENIITLSAGGCVCIPSEYERRDNISDAIIRMRVNFVSVTPSSMRVIKQEAIHGLTTILLAGEPPSAEDMQAIPDSIKVINGYGPTECTILCTLSTYVPEDPRVIGRGIGCATWIVDRHDHRKLMPIGAIGELMIEGPAIASKYINASVKDATAFEAYPLWLTQLRGCSDGRLYKTGDLVQYTPDGSIRFIGRKDNQAKLHGQRIELEEVEHRVRKAFPCTADVVVDVIRPSTNSRRSAFLVAFILQRSNQVQPCAVDTILEPPSNTFRACVEATEALLHRSLPTYMVPGVYLPLNKLPQTLSCKTNRKLLRQLAAELSADEISQYGTATLAKRLPATPMEMKLQELLSRLLRLPLDSISMNNHFFRLGGDSLESMRLAAMAREEGVVLSVVDIFKHPIISQMAVCARFTGEDGHEVEMQQGPSLLTSSVNDGLLGKTLTDYQLDARNVIDVLPTTAFQRDSLSKTCSYFLVDVPGHIDTERLNMAVQELAMTHQILRTVFISFNNSLVQVVLRNVDIPVEMLNTDTTTLISTAENTSWQDSTRMVPFGAPPFKMTLISSGKDHHALIFRLSHAQYDAQSISVLLADFAKAYNGQPLAVTATYTDYMTYRAQQISLDAINFWHNLLNDSCMTYLEPDSLIHYTLDDSHPEKVIIRTSPVSTTSLPRNVTPATVFKAAWALTLARETGTHDLVFTQVVNGRNLALEGVEKVLGPCVNIIPVRAILEPHWVGHDLLQYLQTQYIQALPFETLDFDHIAANCTNWRSGTLPGSVIHYQHINSLPSVNIHGMQCSVHASVFDHGTKYLFVECANDTACSNAFTVRVIASSTTIDEARCDHLLEQLCNIFIQLITEPDRGLLDFGVNCSP